MELKIVDDDGRECPSDTPGEIVIKSRYLAAGYWRDDKLTDERFTAAPEGDGYRIFRTRDLGRLDAQGNLTILGRIDDVVKIGGLRVDIGEIEGALSRLPGVASGAVCAFEIRTGQTQLVAYVVCRPDAASPRDFRRRLRTVLPRHMVPHLFVFLDAMPLAPTGKIDRAKLRQILPQRAAGAGHAPRTETERLLGRFWQEALEIDGVSADDDFFDLGGNSLAAVVIVARIHAATGVGLDLEAFTNHPTLGELAAHVDARQREPADEETAAFMPVPRDEPLPLSPLQDWMWKAAGRAIKPRNFVGVHSYRITGPLNPAILRDSINYVIGRHESLRTTFVTVDGAGRQVVHPPVPIEVPVIDLSGAADPAAEAERLFVRESARTFDLSAAPPLAFTLLRLAADEHRLLRANHHLNSDAQSWRVFFSEVATVYEAALRGRAAAVTGHAADPIRRLRRLAAPAVAARNGELRGDHGLLGRRICAPPVLARVSLAAAATATKSIAGRGPSGVDARRRRLGPARGACLSPRCDLLHGVLGGVGSLDGR